MPTRRPRSSPGIAGGLASGFVGAGLTAAERTDETVGSLQRIVLVAAFALTGVVGGLVVTRKDARD